jgi:hypothetical protein
MEGGPEPRAMLLWGAEGEGEAERVADLAVAGLMPEQVALALQQNAQRPPRQRAPLLAGVDARTARAYT